MDYLLLAEEHELELVGIAPLSGGPIRDCDHGVTIGSPQPPSPPPCSLACIIIGCGCIQNWCICPMVL